MDGGLRRSVHSIWPAARGVCWLLATVCFVQHARLPCIPRATRSPAVAPTEPAAALLPLPQTFTVVDKPWVDFLLRLAKHEELSLVRTPNSEGDGAYG